MTSEPKEYVKPYRSGRMKGVYIPIDMETWEYVLRQSGIPIDTPLSKLNIRRYATKDLRIILKVSLVKEA